MKRNSVLKIINLLLLLDFIGIIFTVFVVRYVNFDIFVFVHPKLGYLFVLLVFSHLALNWNWIKANYLKRRKKNKDTGQTK